MPGTGWRQTLALTEEQSPSEKREISTFSPDPSERELALAPLQPLQTQGKVVTAGSKLRERQNLGRAERNTVKKQERDQQRQSLYEQMVRLKKADLSIRAIAAHLEKDNRTVAKWLQAGKPLEASLRPNRKSGLDRYKSILADRLCCEPKVEVQQLFKEIKELGYKGGSTVLYDYLRNLRSDKPKLPAKPKGIDLTNRTLAWLLVAPEEKLKSNQLEQLKKLLVANEKVKVVYQLGQEFLRMIRERDLESWGNWLSQVREKGPVPLQSLANGLLRDGAAVKNALRSEISNGQVEGKVNLLKFLKRSMFGRGKLDLLKARMIHRPQKLVKC